MWFTEKFQGQKIISTPTLARFIRIFHRRFFCSTVNNTKKKNVLFTGDRPKKKNDFIRINKNLKKNGAARLDPWEIFLLLPLKIRFHFILLRKLKNYLQFYMRIAFKFNRTTKKVHHKFEIAFHLWEIPLKCFLSPLGDTLSPRG